MAICVAFRVAYAWILGSTPVGDATCKPFYSLKGLFSCLFIRFMPIFGVLPPVYVWQIVWQIVRHFPNDKKAHTLTDVRPALMDGLFNHIPASVKFLPCLESVVNLDYSRLSRRRIP